MKFCTINDINVYLYQCWILKKGINCQILTIICIFIYNNEIYMKYNVIDISFPVLGGVDAGS